MQKRKWAYVAIAVVLVYVGIRIYTYPLVQLTNGKRKALESTFRQYSKDILARDYAAAYSLGDQAFRESSTMEGFIAEQQGLETKLGPLESSTETVGIEAHGSPTEWTGLVREIRNYRNGRFHVLYEFRFEDGRWQLYGFKQDD
jgi:hypothetical protein